MGGVVHSFAQPLSFSTRESEVDTQHRLLGTYQTPQFDYGSSVMCEVRGEVVITGLTNARIPWPIASCPGSRGPGQGSTFIVRLPLGTA